MKNTSYIPIVVSIAMASAAAGKTVPNHAIADLVLGQPGFVTEAELPVSSIALKNPSAVVVDPVSGKVFVADAANNRVLRYPNASSLTNNAAAEAIFGQPRFSSDNQDSPTVELGMDEPKGLFLDRLGRLWVADEDNHRVIMFEAAVFRTGQPFSDKVFGQATFLTSASGLGSNGMELPSGVWVDANDTLWVADRGNNRILRFDTVSNNNFQNSSADAVLGQNDFVTGTSGAGAANFSFPSSITVSASGDLFVADSSNNRILRYNNAATLGNGASATGVLGQLDFVGTSPGLSDAKMDDPRGVFITPDDSLWVSDDNSNRVIRFDAASTKANGAAANGVVGQPNFTTGTAATTDRGLDGTIGHPFVDGAGSLWISENDNDRVVRFPADETKPLLVVTTTVPKQTKKRKVTIDGTATDQFGIALVQFQVGTGPLQPAVGTSPWQIKPALKKGGNIVTIFATDSVGNLSVKRVFRIKRK